MRAAADIIATLQRLGRADPKPAMADLVAEMLLSIPVRISYLVPHMRSLVPACTHALRSTAPELPMQALRTLEQWVDVMTPDSWDVVVGASAPVRPCWSCCAVCCTSAGPDGVWQELLRAVCAQVSSPAPNVARLAFEVLGRLGGRSRAVLRSVDIVRHRGSGQRDRPAV
jgi:hypothetical protein